MRINLVGAAPSSAHLAPTDLESWVCGAHYQEVKHLNVDRIYEIHEHVFDRPEYVDQLLKTNIELVMAKNNPFEAKEFDFKRSEELIGRLYLTSTMSYMISDAISDGYKEIYLYGITLSAEGEYYSQRPAMEWWIGYAQGLGIKVVVPDNCPLGHSGKIYGRSYQKGPFDEDSIQELINAHKKKANELQSQSDTLRTMEVAQASCIDLLEKLVIVSRRYNDGEVVKRLTDMIRVK